MESFRSGGIGSDSYLAETRYLKPQFDKIRTTALDTVDQAETSATRSVSKRLHSKRQSSVASPVFKGSKRATGVDKLIMDSVYAYQDQYRSFKAEEK